MMPDETLPDGDARHSETAATSSGTATLPITVQHASFLASLKAEVAKLDPNVGVQLRAALEYVEEAGLAIAKHYADEGVAAAEAELPAAEPAPAVGDVAKVAATDEAAKTS